MAQPTIILRTSRLSFSTPAEWAAGLDKQSRNLDVRERGARLTACSESGGRAYLPALTWRVKRVRAGERLVAGRREGRRRSGGGRPAALLEEQMEDGHVCSQKETTRR